MKDKIILNIEKIIWSRDGSKRGDEIYFLCPCHDDHNPSARWNPEKETWYCDVCGVGGGWNDLAQRLGVNGGSIDPLGTSCTTASGSKIKNENAEIGNATYANACTLVEYAEVKKLPPDFLKGFGLTDFKYERNPTIRIPYKDENGEEKAVRFRVALQGKDRFRWKTGSKPFLYGLWKIKETRSGRDIILVEGESDCHTLWYHGFPALGLPGASNWLEKWSQFFNEFETIYVFIEPDKGGDAILNWLAKSKIKDRVKLVKLDNFKDVSALHIYNPDHFRDTFQKALNSGTSWSDHKKVAEEAVGREKWEICRELATQPNILAAFSSDLTKLGFVGNTKPAILIYLALVSRLLNRPVSVAVKGTSSGGKSFVVEMVLKFFPKSTYHALSAMSEHALIYSEEPLSHRFLVLFEAAGLGGKFANYIIRSLLSEGQIRYEYVDKTKNGLKPRLIEKEGPTGLILTTTKISLHPENETRLLSFTISDSSEQTRLILKSLARPSEKDVVFFEKWHAFQEWLTTAETRVEIPFAEKLAGSVPPVAVRLRRDFHHILTLIRSYAILHQATRQQDKDGSIIATLDDYAAIRNLVADFISEGVGATVSSTVRETIETVKELFETNPDCKAGVSIAQLSIYLKLDPSAVRRRAHQAIELGYIKNTADARKPIRLEPGDPLPPTLEILPDPSKLVDEVQECSESGGDTTPSPARVDPFGGIDGKLAEPAINRCGKH